MFGGNYTKFIWKGAKLEPPILKMKGPCPIQTLKPCSALIIKYKVVQECRGMSNSRRPKPKNQVFLLTRNVSILNCQRAGELSHVSVEKTEVYTMLWANEFKRIRKKDSGF